MNSSWRYGIFQVMEAAEFLQTHTKKNQAGNRKPDQILGFLEGSVFRMKPLKTATMQYEQLHYRNKEVKQVLVSSWIRPLLCPVLALEVLLQSSAQMWCNYFICESFRLIIQTNHLPRYL